MPSSDYPCSWGGSRALEIILGSDDFDAETAALYGWINRGLPDDEWMASSMPSLVGLPLSTRRPSPRPSVSWIVERSRSGRPQETQESFLTAFVALSSGARAGSGDEQLKLDPTSSFVLDTTSSISANGNCSVTLDLDNSHVLSVSEARANRATSCSIGELTHRRDCEYPGQHSEACSPSSWRPAWS